MHLVNFTKKKTKSLPDKKRERKKPALSIRQKLFIYLTIFCAFVLVLLWVSQIVFLDDFYYMITIRRLRSTAAALSVYDPDYIQSAAIEAAIDNEVNILVYLTSGKLLASVDFMYDGILHRLDSAALNRFYNSAIEGGGESITQFKFDSLRQILTENDPDNDGGNTLPPSKESNGEESSNTPISISSEIIDRIIYTKTTTNPHGQSIIIMLDCAISPISAVTRTLTVQLGAISVILVIAALLLARLISRRVSSPIIKINQSAKVLASGNYEADFSGHGYREITELSDTLNYAARELSKVENLRRELIANVSHDLRTPLTMITGYSEVMRDIPGENTPENIQVIIDESKRLSSLVNDLLELSKYQSGSGRITKESFDLCALLENTVARYRKMTEIDGYTIELYYKEELFVYADRARILQVVYNLINNAINYTGEDGRIIIRLYRRENVARVEICDTGEGIVPEQIPYIWDRYYKTDKAHRRAAVGTGLGLSIVKNILELHRAAYGARSDVNAGSTFWFELECASDKNLSHLPHEK